MGVSGRDRAREPGTEEVALGDLAQSIGFLLRIAQVQTFERFFAAFDGIDLRPGEFSVIWVIRGNPGIRQGLVADTLGIKPAQMTKMIRRLEAQGRIRRVIPDNDRRSVKLFLTDAGEAFASAHEEAFFGHEDHRSLGLTETEWRDLARLLRRYTGLER